MATSRLPLHTGVLLGDQPSLCLAGMALTVPGCNWGRVWSPLVARGGAVRFLCLGGLGLGAIGLHFAQRGGLVAVSHPPCPNTLPGKVLDSLVLRGSYCRLGIHLCSHKDVTVRVLRADRCFFCKQPIPASSECILDFLLLKDGYLPLGQPLATLIQISHCKTNCKKHDPFPCVQRQRCHDPQVTILSWLIVFL